jgi:hypothetical protein
MAMQEDFTMDIWQRVMDIGRLRPRDWAGLSATCTSMRALLQPRRVRCIKPASVSQLAAAARHWRHAEEIRLPLQGLVFAIGDEDTCALNSILERALGLAELRRLQLLEVVEEEPRASCRFLVMLRNRLLEAPLLQVLHLQVVRLQTLPMQAFMQLRELKLEVAESLSDAACTALCQVSTLQMLFLSCCGWLPNPEEKNLPLGSFDLRGLQNLTMAGLSRLAPAEFKLPPDCIFVFWGDLEGLMPMHRIHAWVQSIDSGAFQHIAAEHPCPNLTHIHVSGKRIGTLQEPVVVQLPGLEVLRLVAEDTLHVSLQGALPRVLELSAAYVPLDEEAYEDDLHVGSGFFSLHAEDVAALADSLEEMDISYRSLHGNGPALPSLLELLAKRQADVHCGAFRHCPSASDYEWQVEYDFRVKRRGWEGLVSSMECVCRACRWGARANGPFQEYTYHAEVRRNGRRVSTFIDFNNMAELRHASVSRGGAIIPGFQLPTDYVI